jgi:hypothetical protein
MVADPLLRRLETAHILSTEATGGSVYIDPKIGAIRSARWLKIIETAKLGKVSDADYLGWLAYNAGDYKAAQRWLDLSADSAVASWLRAKLDLRAGKMKEAAAAMATAWDGLKSEADYSGWPAETSDDTTGYLFVGGEEEGNLRMSQWASGDAGSIRLLRSDFVQAMDTFIKGDLRNDAAYVAERVLSADELRSYVDQMPPAKTTGSGDDRMDDTSWLRYLLGRRLVREDRYAEARGYLKAPYDKLLDKYTEALNVAGDAKQPKEKRAAAWSTAAWIARYDGMELMGTEVAPDGFDSGGDFEDTDLATNRIQGTYVSVSDDENASSKKPPRLPYPPAKAEIDRLKAHPIRPDVRYHYRVIAAALAMKAAALLPDNTEELADAVNNAGNWVKDRDDKLGDKYYQVIEKRCAKTKIGRADIAKHWFVDQPGPWSGGLQDEATARDKALGITQN